MESFRNPYEEDINESKNRTEDQDEVNERYAAKAMARLDEMFRLQDLADNQISNRAETHSADSYGSVEARQKPPSESYEEDFIREYESFQDPDAEDTDSLLGDQKKAFEETIRILRANGIDPLDSESSGLTT